MKFTRVIIAKENSPWRTVYGDTLKQFIPNLHTHAVNARVPSQIKPVWIITSSLSMMVGLSSPADIAKRNILVKLASSFT